MLEFFKLRLPLVLVRGSEVDTVCGLRHAQWVFFLLLLSLNEKKKENLMLKNTIKKLLRAA